MLVMFPQEQVIIMQTSTTANSRVECVEAETNELIFKLLPPTERHLKLCSKHFSVILE